MPLSIQSMCPAAALGARDQCRVATCRTHGRAEDAVECAARMGSRAVDVEMCRQPVDGGDRLVGVPERAINVAVDLAFDLARVVEVAEDLDGRL